jgi:hypothetical protein
MAPTSTPGHSRCCPTHKPRAMWRRRCAPPRMPPARPKENHRQHRRVPGCPKLVWESAGGRGRGRESSTPEWRTYARFPPAAAGQHRLLPQYPRGPSALLEACPTSRACLAARIPDGKRAPFPPRCALQGWPRSGLTIADHRHVLNATRKALLHRSRTRREVRVVGPRIAILVWWNTEPIGHPAPTPNLPQCRRITRQHVPSFPSELSDPLSEMSKTS